MSYFLAIERTLILKVANIEIRNDSIIFEAWDEITNLENNTSTYIPKTVKIPLKFYNQNQLENLIDEYIFFEDSDNLAEIGSFETYFKADSFSLIPEEYVFHKNWIYSKSISGILLNIANSKEKILFQIQVDTKIGKKIITVSCYGVNLKDISNLKKYNQIHLKDLIITRFDSKTFYSTRTTPEKLPTK